MSTKIEMQLNKCIIFSFQEHIASNPPNKVLEVDEFLALRKEVRHMLKHDVTSEPSTDNPDVPPGDEDAHDVVVICFIWILYKVSDKFVIAEF